VSEPWEEPGPSAGPPSVVSLGPTPRRPNRRRYVVTGVVTLAIMLVAGAAGLPMLHTEPSRGQRTYAGLGAVMTYAGLSVTHTDGDVDYPTTPPVGGPHDPVWLECGAYDEQVRDENAVHDLEHGAVWIAYDPDLDASDVRALAERLPQDGIMAPYVGLPAPVVVSVWGRQLRLTGADDERLGLFVATFGHGETAPEPDASCAGGSRDPRGGHGPQGTAI
jgi:hypothetical protein